jgi:hypothetical protein
LKARTPISLEAVTIEPSQNPNFPPREVPVFYFKLEPQFTLRAQRGSACCNGVETHNEMMNSDAWRALQPRVTWLAWDKVSDRLELGSDETRDPQAVLAILRETFESPVLDAFCLAPANSKPVPPDLLSIKVRCSISMKMEFDLTAQDPVSQIKILSDAFEAVIFEQTQRERIREQTPDVAPVSEDKAETSSVAPTSVVDPVAADDMPDAAPLPGDRTEEAHVSPRSPKKYAGFGGFARDVATSASAGGTAPVLALAALQKKFGA